MNFYASLSIIASLFLLALGMFIFVQGLRMYKAHYKVAFACGCLCCFLWLFFASIMYITEDLLLASICGKIALSGAIFTAMTFHHFIVLLLNRHERPLVIFTYLLGAICIALTWAPNGFIKGYYRFDWGYYPRFTFLNIFSILLFAILFARGAFLSYYGYHDKLKSGFVSEANRIRYIFWGFVVGPVAGIDYLPGYGFDFYPFGFLIMTAWVSIISYAILRHKLMDIEVIIKKTLVFAGLFGFVFGVIVVVAILTQEFIAAFLPHSRFLSLAISAVIIVLLHQPIYGLLVNLTNKYLFQKKYDARKIFHDFSNEALTILNLDRLCRITIETLVTNLYLENCAIFLLSRDETFYEIYDSSEGNRRGSVLKRDGCIINYFKITQAPVIYNSYTRELQASDEIKKEMLSIQSQLCIPLTIHNDIVGVLSLGPKKSDQPYTFDDIDILSTLAKALSIAISNARLFAQAAQYEKLATIGTLASGINHEVCNPLNNMSMRMQIFMADLERGVYKDKTQDEILSDVKDVLNRSITQIHKVADITCKLSGFAKPTKTVLSKKVNVAQSVNAALDILGHKLTLDKIKTSKNIPENLPDILADEDQMQQIFFNLIRNAAQAIKEEGEIAINAKEDSGKIKVEVSDTGCGIPEDKIKKIFEPFYTTKSDGNGYGLSIVREVVWRNKGEIRVESKVGKGTVFYLEFPKA
ncbi:MAG: ATP-binding protein [Candidatus Omnitrophica bacterium]|nr:ATP-binding protein [Candidatus Omnitrophota bacterium]